MTRKIVGITVGTPISPKVIEDKLKPVTSVNGIEADEDGNVNITIPEPGENVDLTGYATEQWVQEGYQTKGDYALKKDIPHVPENVSQLQNDAGYLTEVPHGYATEEFVANKIAEDVDLSGYAQKSELPEKVSQLENDEGYLTAVPDGYARVEDIPTIPVQSVNGKTGTVKLSASDVGARANTWMPTAQEVGALPNTYTPPNQTAAQVGADPKGTASSAVSTHNTSDKAHGDLRLLIKELSDKWNAFFDSDDATMDQATELIKAIKDNAGTIGQLTSSKVSTSDIINDLITNVTNKPLSAAQGVVLKGLIDTLEKAIPTKVSQLTNDKGYLTQHQDVSGKLDASKLQEAISTALEQAQASGEFDGADGEDGEDGVSPTVTVSKSGKVTTITIKDATGTKTATINDGNDGSNGTNGTSVTVSNVSESTASGGTNVVTFSDGKKLNIKNGTNGTNGTSVNVKSVSESTADGGDNVVTFSDGKSVTIKNGKKGDIGPTGPQGPQGPSGYQLTNTDKTVIAEEVADMINHVEYQFMQQDVDFTNGTDGYKRGGEVGKNLTAYNGTANNCKWIMMTVQPGEKYRTTGRMYYEASVFVVTTSSDVIVLSGEYGKDKTITETFTIPENGARLYLNDNKARGAFISLEKEVPVGASIISISKSPISYKTIVYDGDSICHGGRTNGGYARLIAEKVGGMYVNQAVGGGRLVSQSAGHTNHSIVDNLPNLPTTGDLYCFQGGVNDYWSKSVLGTYSKEDFTGTLDTTTVCGALETIFRYALNTFVGKPVCFVITHKCSGATYNKNTLGDTFEDYRNAMVGICNKYSIPYYDAFSESGLNGWNTVQKNAYTIDADGTHPTEDGYKRYYVPQLINLFEQIMPVE